jgi:hypothetical protein
LLLGGARSRKLGFVLRELITKPISTLTAVLEFPRTMERSVRQANELMDVSQDQLEVMRRQADEALAQAERMNDLLARLVKLTEPIEKAQRGGEFVSEQLKRVLLGEAAAAAERAKAEANRAEAEADRAEAEAEADPAEAEAEESARER